MQKLYLDEIQEKNLQIFPPCKKAKLPRIIREKLNDKIVSEKRLKKLQKLLENFQIENNKNYINKSCEVLVENKLKKQESYFGRTKCMTPVIFDTDKCIPGDLIDVEIKSFNKKNLFGTYKKNKEKAA